MLGAILLPCNIFLIFPVDISQGLFTYFQVQKLQLYTHIVENKMLFERMKNCIMCI